MCHLVFRAGELVGGNMSYYCSITECTKRQCKGMFNMNQEEIQIKPSNIYTSVDPDVSENLSVSIPIYFPSQICQK